MKVENLKPADAGRVLGIGRDTVYKLLREGALPYIWIGKRRFIPRQALQHWLAEGLQAGRTATTADARTGGAE